MDALSVLKKYWNFDHFREPQQEIIQAVLDGKDTLALLPTGGGKSLCFQVPAMIKDGICIVVSPLIALMKDQVENLRTREIKAIALTGSLSADAISDLLDNCRFGNYKFLYLSPERLQSDWIIDRLKELPVNLIAIDEAHCISQWGHDFRPAYLKIPVLKPHFPEVPFLALTASATDRVQAEIVERLEMKNPSVFKKSFARENLGYMVYSAEDKLFRASQILTKYTEPSILYVRNRKACHEVSAQLNSLGIAATFYHGGLRPKEKEANMALWMRGQVQAMVATNAFGMGIDKANVRTVIHLQLPENLENYYQEAGRAGRSGEKAFAVLLAGPSDASIARNQFVAGLPDKEFVKKLYVKLCNYFQIAYGEGLGESFGFSLNQFCGQYDFPVQKAYNAMQFLDRQGVISLSQEFSEKISAQFIIESKEVLRYISLNPQDEPVLSAILRNYPGIYELPSALNLSLIGRKSGKSEQEIRDVLDKLKKRDVIEYDARSNDATLTFTEVREDEHTINRVSKYLESQNRRKSEQLESVIDYVSNHTMCRQNLLLLYFGEKPESECGNCSYCIGKKPSEKSEVKLSERIEELLDEGKMNSREIENRTGQSSQAIIFALRELLENGSIALEPDNRYSKIK